jgi:hypothetical protein
VTSNLRLVSKIAIPKIVSPLPYSSLELEAQQGVQNDYKKHIMADALGIQGPQTISFRENSEN